MLAYAMVGTNDKPKALAFYDAVLGELGYGRTMDFGNSQAYGSKDNPMAPGFAVGIPYDGRPASVGNGTMIAIMCASESKIAAAHAKALALGAKDEGAPGARSPQFYAAYFRDLDGNKICLSKF